jgi:hypothetical protein
MSTSKPQEQVLCLNRLDRKMKDRNTCPSYYLEVFQPLKGGCRLVVEHLPRIYHALGSICSMKRTEKNIFWRLEYCVYTPYLPRNLG